MFKPSIHVFNLVISNCFIPSKKSRKDIEELLSKEEKIDELQARCNSYETEMEKFMAENNDLMNQLSRIQEVRELS